MPIITIDEARSALKIADNDTEWDDELQQHVNAITTVVENHVGQTIERRECTERLRLRGGPRFVLQHFPVVSLTSLTSLLGTVYPTTGMDVDPATGTVEVFRGVVPCGTVVAVYEAGYDTVPDNFKRGALVILEHVWEIMRGVGDVMGGVIGEEERLNRQWMYIVPRKALEWLGEPAPGVG